LTGHGGNCIRTWFLRGDSRPLDELRALAESIAGQRIDSGGRAVALPIAEARMIWSKTQSGTIRIVNR
jgi:hypothetical protein